MHAAGTSTSAKQVSKVIAARNVTHISGNKDGWYQNSMWNKRKKDIWWTNNN